MCSCEFLPAWFNWTGEGNPGENELLRTKSSAKVHSFYSLAGALFTPHATAFLFTDTTLPIPSYNSNHRRHEARSHHNGFLSMIRLNMSMSTKVHLGESIMSSGSGSTYEQVTVPVLYVHIHQYMYVQTRHIFSSVYRVLVWCPTYGKRATSPAARRLPSARTYSRLPVSTSVYRTQRVNFVLFTAQ